MIEEVIETIEKAVDVVDKAITSQDYSQMSRQINDLFHPKSGDNLYRDVSDKYPGSKYRGGHMEKSKSKLRQEPPAWARGKEVNLDPPEWAKRQRAAGAHGGTYTSRGQDTVARQRAYTQREQARAEARKANKEPVYIAEPSKAPGIVLTVVGILGMIATLPMGISLLSQGEALAITGGLFELAVTAGFGFVAYKGISALRRIKRLGIYKELLGTKLYADVKDLASAVKKPVAKVVSEIKKMVTDKIFPQGHFDKAESTFMATDAIYQNYLDVEARQEELKRQQEAEDAAYADLSPEARKAVKKGKEYIDEIREANENIPDPVVSEKLSRMEEIVTRIFKEARERPELTGRLNMLIEYYLPTTGKLLKAYREMSEQPIQGENIRTARAEIEDSLDTINDAFENLLDSFFEDEALDLSTDISVMKHVMKQQGLTDADMKAEKPASEEDVWENGPTLSDLSEAIKEQEKAMASVRASDDPS